MLLRVLKVLAAGDTWFNDRVEGMLVWLEEWLSISQKWAERGTMVLYLMMIFMPPHWSLIWIGAKIALVLFLATMMWALHRKPAAARRLMYRDPLFGPVRGAVGIFLLLIGISCFVSTPHQFNAKAVGIAQMVYLVFFYMTDISSDGQPGRRRKLALAELKKLFGTEWLPKPVTTPG
jgi:hypothetical protein